MTSMYLANPAYTMIDSTKGSMTNRYQCAKEHFKNNIDFTLKTGALYAATAGVGYVAYKNPKNVTNLAEKIGKLLTKNKTPKDVIAKVDIKSVQNLARKKGKLALIAAGIALVSGTFMHILANHTFKRGQIDQKYTDAAKIESQTKNVILESKLAVADEKNVNLKNARGLIS